MRVAGSTGIDSPCSLCARRLTLGSRLRLPPRGGVPVGLTAGHCRCRPYHTASGAAAWGDRALAARRTGSPTAWVCPRPARADHRGQCSPLRCAHARGPGRRYARLGGRCRPRVRSGCALLVQLGPRGGIARTGGWILRRGALGRRIACAGRATPLLLELACDSALFLLFLCQAVVWFGHWNSCVSECSADALGSLLYSDSAEVPTEYCPRAVQRIGVIPRAIGRESACHRPRAARTGWPVLLCSP